MRSARTLERLLREYAARSTGYIYQNEVEVLQEAADTLALIDPDSDGPQVGMGTAVGIIQREVLARGDAEREVERLRALLADIEKITGRREVS